MPPRKAAPKRYAREVMEEAARLVQEKIEPMVRRLVTLTHMRGSRTASLDETAADMRTKAFFVACHWIAAGRKGDLERVVHRAWRNMAFDRSRRKKSHRELSGEASEIALKGVRDWGALDPARGAEAAEAMQRIHRLIRTQCGPHTKVLIDTINGLSIDEIAAKHGIPRGTVLSRLHRARERLLPYLKPPAMRKPGPRPRKRLK